MMLDLSEVECAVGPDLDAKRLADVDRGSVTRGAVVLGGARAGDGVDDRLRASGRRKDAARKKRGGNATT